MKNCKTTTTSFKCRLFNVYKFIIIALFTLIAACQPEEKEPEEKEQEANMQTADSSNTEINKKASDTLVMRPVFPGGDAIQQGCMFVQGRAETLLEEYYRPGTTTARMKQITAALENLDLEWKAMDCQQVFGFMIPEIPDSTGRSKGK